MTPTFSQAMADDWTRRALGHAVYGGADFGEVQTTAARVTIGDVDSWYQAWTATADRVAAIAADCAANGHTVSARSAFLRASNYYRTAYAFLYGAPVDPRLVTAFDNETAAFHRAAALFDPPVEPVEIPYQGTTLPGYFYRVDESPQPRPTLIATNGYDSTLNEMHFAHAVAALSRGYNCLLFDGPGQGRPLIKQQLFMRPDWEQVVTPVVDYALSRPEVDPARLALVGWSWGGYLAPRAASGEHRLAACIADPGLWDMGVVMHTMLARFGVPPAALQQLPELDPAVLAPVAAAVAASPELHWTFVQRNQWVHGVDTLADYLTTILTYTLSDRVAQIQCPTLITWGENDPLSNAGLALYDALTCPKQVVRFTAAEGAGDHCEMQARTLFHQRAFDWLDAVLLPVHR